MKSIRLYYQIWVRCSREIEVPNNYTIPSNKSDYDLFVDLREKYPDHEIWDSIPDNDGDGDLDIYDHLDYINGMGLDIQEEGKTYQPEFDIKLD